MTLTKSQFIRCLAICIETAAKFPDDTKYTWTLDEDKAQYTFGQVGDPYATPPSKS